MLFWIAYFYASGMLLSGFLLIARDNPKWLDELNLNSEELLVFRTILIVFFWVVLLFKLIRLTSSFYSGCKSWKKRINLFLSE